MKNERVRIYIYIVYRWEWFFFESKKSGTEKASAGDWSQQDVDFQWAIGLECITNIYFPLDRVRANEIVSTPPGCITEYFTLKPLFSGINLNKVEDKWRSKASMISSYKCILNHEGRVSLLIRHATLYSSHPHVETFGRIPFFGWLLYSGYNAASIKFSRIVVHRDAHTLARKFGFSG